MCIFLDILGCVFLVAGVFSLLGMMAGGAAIIPLLAFGFGALILASSVVIDRLRAAVREMESWRRAGE